MEPRKERNLVQVQGQKSKKNFEPETHHKKLVRDERGKKLLNEIHNNHLPGRERDFYTFSKNKINLFFLKKRHFLILTIEIKYSWNAN